MKVVDVASKRSSRYHKDVGVLGESSEERRGGPRSNATKVFVI